MKEGGGKKTPRWSLVKDIIHLIPCINNDHDKLNNDNPEDENKKN
jgi:hypothetical protein